MADTPRLTVDEPTLLDEADGRVKLRMYVRLAGRAIATLGAVGDAEYGEEMLRAARGTRLRVLSGDARALRALFPDPDLRERIAAAA